MRDIVSDEDVLGGAPRLAGTRIGVLHVYRQYQDDTSPEAIASNYEDVSVADVHSALAFVFDNPDRIRSLERAEREAVERIREERPVDPEEFTKRA
jgi:uncharacterized protein (DUF433 family)